MSYGAQEVKWESAPAARQNPILRAYFRKQFANMRSFRNMPSWRDDPFVEDFVDRQIDHFLSELREKLVLLRARFAHVEQGREAILEAASAEQVKPAQLRWKRSLRGVEKQAGDLWNMLRYVFTELKDRDGFKPRISRQDKESVFRKQMESMGQQINKAEKRIKQYFFEAESTVSLEDLKDENMLIHLYHVREMSKKLKGSF